MSDRVALKRGQAPKAPRRKPAPRQPSMVRLPVSASRARRMFVTGGTVFSILVLGIAGWAMKLPELLWGAAADSVAAAGFEVRHVEVAGLQHLSKLPVYTAALSGRSPSMLDVDLDDVRARLLALPWVKEASVGRRLPDTLTIHITERKPAAIWQYRRRLAVVDAEGRVLDTRTPQKFVHLPLVIGPGANREAGKLAGLLGDFPDIRNRVDSANWMGDRRWDLRFKSGETLSLPEGYVASRTALDSFMRMEREGGLLDRGFARFDMRLPDRMVVRVTNEPGSNAVKALPTSGTEI